MHSKSMARKLFIVTILTFYLLANANDLKGPLQDQFHGDAWQKQGADVKLQKLWAAVTKDTNSGRWPNLLEQAELFIENMPTSFDTIADDMPKQFLSYRKKLIHSVGAIAQAKFISYTGHNYTGLFKGANFGFIRFSSAAENQMVPSFALKFLRNNIKSSNIFTLYSLEGQESKNFFRHDLSNHPPDVFYNASFAILQLRKTFSKASDYPTMLGLGEFAHIDEAGNVEKKS